jgi:hypothetical protein
MYVEFNAEYGVLTDQQGIMLSRADAVALVSQLKQHFTHSPLEMEAIGRRMLEASHPNMVPQFNFEWFNYSDTKVGNEQGN